MDSTLRRCRHALPWLGVLLPLVLTAADDPVDKVSKLTTEWVKTRAETVRLETEWSGQRVLLESMIDALGQRATVVEEKRENAKARTAQDRAELDTLERKNDAAGAGLQASEARLRELDQSLLALRPFLPPRLSAALDLPYKSIGDTTLAVGDRMQHTMTILNRCLQFNRIVTAGEEVLVLAGEPAPKSLEVIYWGLSHGYALDRTAGKVWFGSPGAAGWQWEARTGATEEVSRLLAIANDKADPNFIVVPAKLNHAAR